MKLELTTYRNINLYGSDWTTYSDEVNFEMIHYILKNGGFAFNYDMTNKNRKLYQIVLKDGHKFYTDLGGYRKILNLSRIQKTPLIIHR